jgi:hydrogenase large subunit
VVFRSLPIEYDIFGRARLRDEEALAPFDGVDEARRQRTRQRERFLSESRERPAVASFDIRPLTRVRVPLGLRLMIDFDQRRILDARMEGTECAPQELIVANRPATDAVSILSRTRGGAGGAQAIAACLALEMAGGVAPPPLAILSRNLGSCGEMMADLLRHLFLVVGPDYAAPVMATTAPAIWRRAQITSAPGAALHGQESIAELMRGLTPMTGGLTREALHFMRLASEIATLVYGKVPHPSTILPGGNSVEPSREVFTTILARLNTLLEYVPKVTAIWDDLVDFLLDVEPRYQRLGELPGNLLSCGLWEDHDVYDATYINCNAWASRRYSPPGIIIEGEWRTDRLSDLNIGLEEFVESTYYADRGEPRFATDPMSNPISPRHPWNREMIPLSTPESLAARYTWLPAPRWDREPMESGPLARLWINAISQHTRCEFIHPVRHGLEIDLPKAQHSAGRLVWHLPERPNAFERNRAAAYQIAFAGMVAYDNLLNLFECLRRGESRMSRRFMLPDRSLGVGFWEGAGGAISHHLVVKNQLVTNYQVIGPVDWMCSSRDGSGTPGVVETALLNTPILEEWREPSAFTGIDILRAVHSFAP